MAGGTDVIFTHAHTSYDNLFFDDYCSYSLLFAKTV